MGASCSTRAADVVCAKLGLSEEDAVQEGGPWSFDGDGALLLHEKFGFSFDIPTRGQAEAARTANPFAGRGLLIARLDVLSRCAIFASRSRASPVSARPA